MSRRPRRAYFQHPPRSYGSVHSFSLRAWYLASRWPLRHLTQRRRQLMHAHAKKASALILQHSYVAATRFATASAILASDLHEFDTQVKGLLMAGRAQANLGHNAEAARLMRTAWEKAQQHRELWTDETIENALILSYRLAGVYTNAALFDRAHEMLHHTYELLERFRWVCSHSPALTTHEGNSFWVEGAFYRLRGNLNASYHHYVKAERAYVAMLPAKTEHGVQANRSIPRLYCELTHLELDRADVWQRAGRAEKVSEHLALGERWLAKMEAALGEKPVAATKAMLHIVRRRLELASGTRASSALDEMCALAIEWQKECDQFTAAYALTQAGREVLRFGERVEAIAMFERAKAAITDTHLASRVFAQRELDALRVRG